MAEDQVVIGRIAQMRNELDEHSYLKVGGNEYQFTRVDQMIIAGAAAAAGWRVELVIDADGGVQHLGTLP